MYVYVVGCEICCSVKKGHSHSPCQMFITLEMTLLVQYQLHVHLIYKRSSLGRNPPNGVTLAIVSV